MSFRFLPAARAELEEAVDRGFPMPLSTRWEGRVSWSSLSCTCGVTLPTGGTGSKT